MLHTRPAPACGPATLTCCIHSTLQQRSLRLPSPSAAAWTGSCFHMSMLDWMIPRGPLQLQLSSTLFSSPVTTISTGPILVQPRQEEEMLCAVTSAPWKGACLFVFLSPWEKLQSPKVLQHQGRASSPCRRRPAAPRPMPPPRHPGLGVRRQWPAQDNVKETIHTHTLTHPPK